MTSDTDRYVMEIEELDKRRSSSDDEDPLDGDVTIGGEEEEELKKLQREASKAVRPSRNSLRSH